VSREQAQGFRPRKDGLNAYGQTMTYYDMQAGHTGLRQKKLALGRNSSHYIHKDPLSLKYT
jgi:hypothetical protein